MNAKKKAPPQQEPSDDSGSDTSEDEEVLPKDQDLPVAEEESSSDEEEETQKSKKKKNKADKSESSDDKPVKPEEEKKTIFVGNLPVNTKKEHLKKFFEPNGKVKSVRLRSHTGKKVFNKAQVKKDPFITAYVVFEEETSANAAVEKSERTFRDRRIRVTPAGQKKATNKKTIFVGNLPYATVDEDLHEVFATCGAIESVRTIRGPNGCTGIAYVTFKEKNSLILALQMQGTMIRDRPIRLEKCKDLKKAEEKKNAKKQKTKVVTKVINGKHIKEKVPVTNADNALKRLKKKPGFDENQNQKKENNFKRPSGSGPPGRHQKFGRPGQKPDQKGGRPPFKGGRPDQKGGRPPFKGGPGGGAGKKDFKAKAKKKGLPKNIQLAKRLNVNWKKPTYKAGPKKT